MAAKVTKGVFVVGARRTPFGTFGGKLREWNPSRLGAEAAKGALASGHVDPAHVDSVCIGNVQQTTGDAPYLARHVGLYAGVPIERPMLTLNRLCGSGFQSIVTGTQEISLGVSDVVLAGGAESMSLAPYTLSGLSRWGTRLGADLQLKDSLWECLTDTFCKSQMAATAERLAEKYNISKDECDAFALRSQQLWAKAHAEGLFKAEIVPLTVKDAKGKEQVMDTDEHPRPSSTIEAVKKLPAIFKKGGTVSAGNASGVTDGAAAVVLASEEAVGKHKLAPLARVVSYAVCGVPPEIMGIGPVPAIQAALARAGLTLADMDLVEINEAFAAQFLACAKELQLDMDKTNVHGGAIALGHPTGASGSRIMGHLAHELKRTNKRYAVGAACIGGGQGIAIVLERA